MKEEFLHYLWHQRLFSFEEPRTSSGEELEILDGGHPHQDGGPDFQNARIRIGSTLWAGNVEIHFRSSQWYEHEHHLDPAYDNVILHVVFEDDRACYSSRAIPIEAFELKGRIPNGLAMTYQRFLNDRRSPIPCEGMLDSVPPLLVRSWVDRLAIERLERKAERVQGIWERCGKDLRETFHQVLARYFGGKVNSTPFEELAMRTPLKLLLKYRDRLLSLEALLFGQAGFLQRIPEDPYASSLEKEYRFLQRDHALRPMNPSSWRFLRLRPTNFPTLRIAQYAAFVHRCGDPWHLLDQEEDPKKLRKMFRIKASQYWKDHTKFGKERKRRVSAAIGEAMAANLLINAVSPFLFFYGRKRGRPDREEKAVDLLVSLPAEQNKVLRIWKERGITAEDATRSQGLIELKEQYCERKKCLSCSIGDRILKKKLP